MLFNGLRTFLSSDRDQFGFILSLFIHCVLTFIKIDMYYMIDNKYNFDGMYTG